MGQLLVCLAKKREEWNETKGMKWTWAANLKYVYIVVVAESLWGATAYARPSMAPPLVIVLLHFA